MNPHMQSCSTKRGPRTTPQQAFTLIELMVVIALTGIMLSLAMPSFADIIHRYRINGRLASMEATLALARHEAVRRGRNVTIRGVVGAGCATRQWHCGWEMVTTDDATPPAMLTLKKEDGDTRVFIRPTMTAYSYNAFGQLLGFGNIHFDSEEVNPHTHNQMLLCLSRAGRARQQRGATSCS
ncbi:MAG: GspH/FimT family pseudopilin [Variovorax sp.]